MFDPKLYDELVKGKNDDQSIKDAIAGAGGIVGEVMVPDDPRHRKIERYVRVLDDEGNLVDTVVLKGC